MSENESSLHIQVQSDNVGWTIISDGPMPLSFVDSPQSLDERVWRVYVDYLNAREQHYNESKRRTYRLIRRFIKTHEVVVHV